MWSSGAPLRIPPIQVAGGVGGDGHFGEGASSCGSGSSLVGGSWQGQHICFHSDNMAVVSIVNSKTAKTPQLMHLLRCFAFYCAYYRFHISCVHVPGAMNTAADALSRNNLKLFSTLAPQALRCPIPVLLVELLVTTRPDWGSPAWTQLFVRSLTKVLPDPH